MEFRIADTFTDGLAKLRGEEQTAAKTTGFDKLNTGRITVKASNHFGETVIGVLFEE